MKKILFILFAALAFVACDKEENSNTSFVRTRFHLENSEYNAEAGTVIKVKTPMPSCNMFYNDELGEEYKTGVEKIPTVFPSSYENDYYSLVQTSDDTFEITVKPISKPCSFTIVFNNKSTKGQHHYGLLKVNYTPAE